jgi:hypothetical protein
MGGKEMTVNGIEFEFLGDSFLVSDKGRAYTARLKGEYTASQIKLELVGATIPSGKMILGVETFAIEGQMDSLISLLFKE